MRPKPIVKQLSEKYGGVWFHIPFQGFWYCEELDLTAHYVADGGYDVNGNYVPTPAIFQKLYVYGLKTGVEKFWPKKKIK